MWGTILYNIKFPKVSKSKPSRLQNKRSFETCSKSHASSLQEHFVRDFFQNSFVKSPKRAFRTRRLQKLTLQVCKASVSYKTSSKIHALRLQNEPSSKSQAGSPIGAHTSSSPAKQFRDSSPSKQHPLTCQSQWHSDTHPPQLATSHPHLPQKFARPRLQHGQSTAPATRCDLRHTS